MLESLLFVLVGLQFPLVVDRVEEQGVGELLVAGVVLSLVVMAVRLVHQFTVLEVDERLGGREPIGWRDRLVVGWSGMRGAISLAVALAVPVSVAGRDEIIFLTICVIGVTLVVQGLTLPVLIRQVGFDEEDVGLDARRPALVRFRTVEAALGAHRRAVLRARRAGPGGPRARALALRLAGRPARGRVPDRGRGRDVRHGGLAAAAPRPARRRARGADRPAHRGADHQRADERRAQRPRPRGRASPAPDGAGVSARGRARRVRRLRVPVLPRRGAGRPREPCARPATACASPSATSRWPTATRTPSAPPQAAEAARRPGALPGRTTTCSSPTRTALEDDDLRRYAAELGLDAERFAADLDSPAVVERVRADAEAGAAAGVAGTPAFFLDGERYTGFYDEEALLDAIEDAAARAEGRHDHP